MPAYKTQVADDLQQRRRLHQQQRQRLHAPHPRLHAPHHVDAHHCNYMGQRTRNTW
jgi:hypothetical protein